MAPLTPAGYALVFDEVDGKRHLAGCHGYHFSTVARRTAATAEFSTFPKAGEIAILRHGR